MIKEKDFLKRQEAEKKLSKVPQTKVVKRFWGNATRLEHRNVGGKKTK